MKAPDTPRDDPASALRKLLKTEPWGLLSRRRIFLVLILSLVAVTAWWFLRSDSGPPGPRYKTEPAIVGKLVVKVSATGKLQPTNKVEVSSELSGIVTQVYVDDNERVKKDQVLAQLDLSKLTDAVKKSRASLVSAEAQVLQAKATVAEAHSALSRLAHLSDLSGGKLPSRSDMDTAEANLKRASANEASAQASVSQARANLQSDETNLYKARIRSPIDGIVLTRKIEPGQTVAAALQAPVLFTLAEDLSKMELLVDIDEADVGQVKAGQHATFGVDAWPNRRYTGLITRVGYNSEEKEGVVSYPTVLVVKNDDLSLRPGMTGTADIVTVSRENALLVPNAALRFSPLAMRSQPKPPGCGLVSKLMPRPPGGPPKPQSPPHRGAPRVWVLRQGKLVPIEVQIGASNGQVTEIVGGPLRAQMRVITEVITEARGAPP